MYKMCKMYEMYKMYKMYNFVFNHIVVSYNTASHCGRKGFYHFINILHICMYSVSPFVCNSLFSTLELKKQK